MIKKRLTLKIAEEASKYSFLRVLKHYRDRVGEVEELPTGTLQCLCPFHEDSNPSLRVDDDAVWHCFPCGEGGNVFQFVAKIESCSVGEAEEILKTIHGLKSNYSVDRLKSLLGRVRDESKPRDKKRERKLLWQEMRGVQANLLTSPIQIVAGAEQSYRKVIRNSIYTSYHYNLRLETFFQEFWAFLARVEEHQSELHWKSRRKLIGYKKDWLELTQAVKKELRQLHKKWLNLCLLVLIYCRVSPEVWQIKREE